ncbi:MAG: hypothetical protein AAF978_05260 [Cyanobacteria bacterium P01_E01_bin.48]
MTLGAAHLLFALSLGQIVKCKAVDHFIYTNHPCPGNSVLVIPDDLHLRGMQTIKLLPEDHPYRLKLESIGQAATARTRRYEKDFQECQVRLAIEGGNAAGAEYDAELQRCVDTNLAAVNESRATYRKTVEDLFREMLEAKGQPIEE